MGARSTFTLKLATRIAIATGVLLLTLPAASAQTPCVTLAVCEAGGGEQLGSICAGGTHNGAPLCLSPSDPKNVKIIRRTPVGMDYYGLYTSPNAGLSFEEPTAFTQFMQSGHLTEHGNPYGAANRLGMSISPATRSGIEISGGGGVTRNSGYSLTDTAGLLAPGAKSASFRETGGGGRIGGFVDLSGMLAANQSLVARGFYQYSASDTTYGDANLPIAGLNLASLKQDTHVFGGSLHYQVESVYLRGFAAFDFGRGDLTNNATGGVGSYSTGGYATGLRAGKVFTLAQGVTYARSARYTKAPPKPVPAYLLGLDLSGHVGYANGRAEGFTDTAGFVYGTENNRSGDIGARARLFALLPGYGVVWAPYIGATVNQLVGVSHTQTFPNQVQLAGGDLVSYSHARTFWGAEGGVDVLNGGVYGWRVGARGFYTSSADTSIAGGSLSLNIPLWRGAPVLR